MKTPALVPQVHPHCGSLPKTEAQQGKVGCGVVLVSDKSRCQCNCGGYFCRRCFLTHICDKRA